MAGTGGSDERSSPFRHAVVLGGSVAGLLAARVLAERFDWVTLIERDALARGPEPRRATPQGRHVHVLLVRGLRIMEVLFPGLGQELVGRGAVPVEAGRGLAWYYGDGWRAPFDESLAFVSVSRPLLEAVLAARVRGLANVFVLEDARAGDFEADAGGRIRGVRVSRPGEPEASVVADLVVDATGRGSVTPRRLETMGFEAPREVRAPVPITYASCLFPRPASPPPWGALLYGAPGARRVGSVFPVEGGRWLATLAGFFDEPAPESHEAFLAFARALPIPDVHEALRGLEPLSPVARYRFAGGLRRRYDRLRRLPEGLVVTGDALCSFNPVYGQGMSVSAIEAERLGAALDGARRAGGLGADFGPRWFKAVRPAIDLAWEGTLLEDLHHPEVRDHASARLRLLQGYLGRVHRATHRCGRVTEQLYRVVNFLDPPSALLRPRILAAVALRGGRP